MKKDEEEEPSSFDSSLGFVVKLHLVVEDIRWSSFNFDLRSVCETVAYSTFSYISFFNILKNIEFALMLCNDSKIAQLNGQFRKVDKATNVLAFPAFNIINKDYSEIKKSKASDSKTHIGDIAMSYDVLLKEALEKGITLENHFKHLLVHALLHLVGYDHNNDEEEREMVAAEVEILDRLGVSNPYILS